MKRQTISVMLILAIGMAMQGTTLTPHAEGNSKLMRANDVQAFIPMSERLLLDVELLKAEKERAERELALEIQKEIERLEQARIEAEMAESLRIQNVEYQNWNLLSVSGITHEEMYQVLANTTMSHLAWAIVEAERTYGVNAFFISAVVALESGWATSSRAINSNNLTGMAVYGDDSPGIYYSSQDECVMDTTRHIRENYLTEGAEYYRGVSSDAVNIKYCASADWYLKINKIAYDLSYDYDTMFK